MREFYVVRCNQTKANGAECMTTFPNENATHSGPCRHCFDSLVEGKKYKELLHSVSHNTHKGLELAKEQKEALKDLRLNLYPDIADIEEL